MINHFFKTVCGLSGQRMTGSDIAINRQKVFRPYGDYNQASEQQQQTKDESKSIQDIIKEALTTAQLTAKQNQALEVTYAIIAEQTAGEFSGSVMQEAAYRLCMDRKTYEEHLMRAAAKHRGVTYEQVKEDAAPFRRIRKSPEA